MGRPATLLEGLCGHAVSLGAQSIEVNYKDGREWVFANKGDIGIGIANYASSSADGKELRENLYAAAKKPVRTVIGGQVYVLKVSVSESFGEDAFAVSIDLWTVVRKQMDKAVRVPIQVRFSTVNLLQRLLRVHTTQEDMHMSRL